VTRRPLSRLELEIREQPDALATRTEAGWECAATAASLLATDDIDYLLVAARGTSDNAARYAQYLLGVEARLPVALAAPWLYEGESPPLLARGAVLAISQSGRSPDITAVVSAAGAQGRPTIVITNDPESPLAAAAQVVVPLLTGPEQSVAATKTYLASLHAIAQLACCLRDGGGRDEWFDKLPALVREMVDRQLSERAQFDRLADVALLTVVGRALQFPTAHETALKVRELSGIPAEAFSPPDLIHGPIAALGSAGALWLISTQARGQPDLPAFESLRQTTSVSVAVSDRAELVAAAAIGIQLPPSIPQWVAPILAVLPGQAAALRLGELHGVDLDHPHGLQKVTLTR
jgi:glutamine---fructose-6-phosphate transaminase (isomerizing)